ncbi:hypothetical protein K461DRAFT_322177 [Myriangium duriaei CBS 260.36]|uniref:Rhodopsin domain-containing protein n=1 Tax=Myriangium duriaei CBS 260.36 TaxID=1168546 RepID=A0A9P4J0E8_9PEZI|nr:hypothetical protein K461DRAFT_322177 [Myriangium duriaei CBS 260.36]
MGDARPIPLPMLIENIHLDQRMGGAFLVLVILAVAVRMYVRLRMTKHFDTQDWAMVLTFFCTVIHICTNIANCSISLKLVDGDNRVLPTFIQLYRTIGFTYVLSLILLKISVGYFFLYIFSQQRFHRFFIYIIMVLSTIFGVVYVPFGVFSCAQFKTYPGQLSNCSKQIQDTASVFFVLFAVVTILGDFAFSAMGCAALWTAKLQRATKISACLLLCFGTIGGIASVVRLSLFLLPADNAAKEARQEMYLIRWMLVELSFSVVAANLVMTKPLFQAVMLKFGFMDASGSNSIDGVTRAPAFANPRGLSDADLRDEYLLAGVKSTARADSTSEVFSQFNNSRAASRVEVV